MKKTLLTALTALTILSAQAGEKCGVIVDYPPGGTSDRYARLLQKYNPDFKIEYKVGGQSVPAMNFLSENPTYIYMGSPVLFGPSSPMKDPPIELYKILIAAPILAVTTRTDLNFRDILNNKINIGVPGFGTAHHFIGEQLKSVNPKVEVISTGGDAKALPLIMNKDIDLYLISATSGLNWLKQFQSVNKTFEVRMDKPYQSNGITLTSVGFNGAFILKTASAEQKEIARRCLDKAISNVGWTRDLEQMGAGPVQIAGEAKDKELQKYIEMSTRYRR
jgi:tripartite-type tricarboxylate transporter receptor subunit TctC